MLSLFVAPFVTWQLSIGAGHAATDRGTATREAEADGSAAAGASGLQPRWIEPRRGSGEPGPAKANGSPPRDWRSDASIVIHAETSSGRLADVVGAMLERTGAGDVDLRLVEIDIPNDEIRYFHTEDAGMAAELATALEPLFGRLPVRDLTFYRPMPPDGTLELWLR